MYSIGDIAKLSNTTVRTLRYYDEIDLLKPSKVDARGQRYYNEKSAAKLQVIVWLKEIGFELQTIKQLFTYQIKSPKELLQMRLEMIQLEKQQLEKSEKAINAILQVIGLEATDNWERIADIFLQVQTTDQNEIKKTREQYFTPEEIEVLNNLPKFSEDREIINEWVELFQDIRHGQHHGPESLIAKEFVERWSALVHKMYNGNWEVAQKTWQLSQNNSDHNLGLYQMDKGIIQFMDEAAAFHFPNQGDGDKSE